MKRILIVSFFLLYGGLFSVAYCVGLGEPAAKKQRTHDFQFREEDLALLESLFPDHLMGVDSADKAEADQTHRAPEKGEKASTVLSELEDPEFEKITEIAKFFELECPICLEHFGDDKRQIILPEQENQVCGHSVCSDCLQHAFSAGLHACPICRTVIPDEFHPEMRRNDVINWDFVAEGDELNFSEEGLPDTRGIENYPNPAEIIRINLSNNNISTVDLRNLAVFFNLKTIIFDSNPLGDLAEGFFGQLPLEVISFEDCRIAQIMLGYFDSLAATLKVIDLESTSSNVVNRNTIRAFPPGLFSALSNLQLLDLRGLDLSNEEKNRITAEVAQATQGRCKIYFTDRDLVTITLGERVIPYNHYWQDLTLANEQIVSLQGLENFEPKDQVKILNLSSNNISELGDQEGNSPFEGFSNLKELYMMENPLLLIHPNVFDTLGNVEKIDMTIAQYTEFPHGLFNNLAALRELRLSSSIIDDDERERITQEVRVISPECEIIFE